MILRRLFSAKSLPTNPILPKKTKNSVSLSQFFVDTKTATVRAGKGGDGLVSFMHLKGNEYAGPDGGDGGNGAHVIFKADKNLKSLNKVNSIYIAESGGEGSAFHMKGKSGQHLTIKVPVGTIFKLKNDPNSIVDLAKHDAMFVAARGGAGGKGNYYYLTNENRRPIQFEPGHPGEEFTYDIELKLIADAALIGYPNVGKSSLLNALTRARAKIGDYSFTTLHPHVGVIEYKDFKQISIADLPGLLPDLTRGFGTRYLHHLERCKMILLTIDLSNEKPLEQYAQMRNVLDAFDSKLLKEKPLLVVGTKIDKENSYENLAKFRQEINLPVIPVSAEKKINLRKLMTLIRDFYENKNKTTLQLE